MKHRKKISSYIQQTAYDDECLTPGGYTKEERRGLSLFQLLKHYCRHVSCLQASLTLQKRKANSFRFMNQLSSSSSVQQIISLEVSEQVYVLRLSSMFWWPPGREGSLGGRDTCTLRWVPSQFTWSYHSIVSIYTPIQNKGLKKKRMKPCSIC